VVSQKWASRQDPLTSLTSRKVKFEWHSSHQQAFDKIKKVIGTEVLLCYPDFNKPHSFHLYTDASDHQLEAVIMKDKNQNNDSLLFAKAKYSSKSIYNHWERVVISYWNLQGIQKILLGYHQPIIVFTDHKNSTFNGLKASDRVLLTSWLLLFEECGETFEYLTWEKNLVTVADALSRLDIDSLKIQEEEVLTLLSGSENNSISNIKFPMHTTLIFKEQAKVKGFREKGLAQPHYSIQHIEGYDLLCYKEKIYIP
jgi:hypothetical protein